jgi:hypothetical protein
MLRDRAVRFGIGRARRTGARAAMACALLFALLAAAAQPAQAQTQPGRRIALVIGNANYTNGGVLDNPEADADAAAAKLASLGFQVTADKNLGQSGMRDLIGNFMSKVRDGDLVLIYYAGHGIEAEGRDYMLPVDVKLETPSAVQFQGIPLDLLYSDKQTFGVIIVFDACRDNPFLRRVKGAVAGTHALSPPAGDLVLFSASSGDVAEDGGADPAGGARKNSVFATAFTNALSVPDASIQRIYQTILREVRAQTSNRQAPQRFGDLAEDFVFNTQARGINYAVAAPLPAAPAPAPARPADTLQVASAATTPPGTLTRSLPVSDPSAGSQGSASPAITPPAATPPVSSPAPKPQPPAAAASPPAPQQLASLSASASPAPARPPPAATAPAAAASPVEMHFTIASLGLNVMPPPPRLDPVPELALPARFCSVEEEIAYLKDVFKPAYDIAYRNNELAIAYLSALNGLGQEYSAHQSGFVFSIKTQFESFAPVAARANQASNDVLGLDAKIRRIPIETCAAKG